MQYTAKFFGVFCVFLLLEITFGAYVSDLTPSTDCKALLAQKADERVKNPDLVRKKNCNTIGTNIFLFKWHLKHISLKKSAISNSNPSFSLLFSNSPIFQANKITTSNEIDYKKATSIFDFSVKDTYMADVPLGDYCRGYVTLIVNLASSCGLTEANYAQLTQLDKDFNDSKKTF